MPSDQEGTITAEAVDSSGQPVSPASMELIDPQTGREVKAGATEVPLRAAFGEYILRVRAPGSYSESSTIRLDQAELRVRVQLRFDAACATIFARLNGSVTSAVNRPQLWVKAVPLIGGGSTEVPVTSRGYFLFPDMKRGSYFVLVVDRSSILHSQTVDLSHNRQITIQLP